MLFITVTLFLFFLNTQSDKERRKAEVRARLEQEAQSKKGKKGGFMTPERKRKLRVSFFPAHRMLAFYSV